MRILNRAPIFALVALTALALLAPAASAQAGGTACADAASCRALANGYIAIGAGLAVGLAGLATGIAQKDIGAAAVGATAEDPGFLGKSIVYIAIPETVVIFGLLIAFQLVGLIGAA